MVLNFFIGLFILTLFFGLVFLKDYYGVNTFIALGIIIPLILYFLNWSTLITSRRSLWFDYIFIVLIVVSVFYALAVRNVKLVGLRANERIEITSNGRILIPFMNVIYVLAYLLENYLGSHTLFPNLNHVDIHTYAAPILSYVTSSGFVILALDLYNWKATRKVRNLFAFAVVLLLPTISRSARMQMMQAAVQIIALYFFIRNANPRKRHPQNKVLTTIVLTAFVFVGGVGLMVFTNYRMNHFGQYSLSYTSIIGYSGPKWLEFLSPYYGYFPLSFNNLNINLLSLHVSHDFLGLYSFACLFFGIFQMDNLFGISTQGAVNGILVTSTAATVPTGFWEFYYDYGILLFIPIVVAFVICAFLKIKAAHERSGMVYRTLYFFYIPLWFLMSFQNVLFGTNIIISMILIAVLIHACVRTVKVDENGVDYDG